MKLFLTFMLCLLTLFGCSQIMVSTITNQFDASGGVKMDDQGNLFIGNFGAGLSNANGTQIWKLDTDFNLSIFATGLQGASGNDFDSQGNFFQSNIAGNRISKVTPDGNVSTFFDLGQGAAPVGIAIDEEDNLFVCQCGNNIIRKITPTGQASIFAQGNIFNCPNGAIFDHEGNLYVSNFSNGWVVKITPDGQTSNFAWFQGNNNGHLTFSPIDTVLYVNSHGSSRIYKVTLDGQQEVLAGSGIRGNADGTASQASFSRPNGIVATPSGDTLFLNSSIPTMDNPQTNFFPLNPSVIRMITGVRGSTTPTFDKWKFDGLNLTISPNPTQDIAKIQYVLPIMAEVKFLVFDTTGKLIETLEQGKKEAGNHEINWNLNLLNSGLYEVVLVGKEFQIARRVLVSK